MVEFLAMGGYGAFVWSAYGFTLLVLIGLAVQSVRSAKRRAAEIEELRRQRGVGAEARTVVRPLIARRADEPDPPAG